MGSTLTNTQPKDTYKSLLKTSDSTELSATAKYVSDGNGNDSPLALSTSAVGIGTSSPATTLDVAGTLRVSSTTPTEEFFNTTNGDVWASIFSQASGTGSGASLVFSTKRDGNTATDKMIITQAGNVGIGTTSPSNLLHLNKASEPELYIQDSVATFRLGLNSENQFFVYTAQAKDIYFSNNGSERMRIQSGGGISFNGDTAAANALDDYEEGTWTPTFNAAVTTSGAPTGKYTKVGRTVYATCTFSYTALTGADINISGLPFTNGAIRQATSVAFAGVARTTNQFFGTLVEASANNFYIEVVNSASGVNLTAHASCWYQV